MSKEIIEIGLKLKQKILKRYNDLQKQKTFEETQFITQKRKQAFEIFKEIGFPTKQLESWKKTNLETVLEKDYNLNFDNNNINNTLKCEVENFETDKFVQLNGKWLTNDGQTKIYKNGTIVSSITAAIQKYPEIFEKHYGKYVVNKQNGLIALNSAMFDQGYFIYVPNNIEHETTLQIQNITDDKENIFVNTRNLVLLGKNAKLSLVHCDESINYKESFITNVTEINLEEGANLDFYKLQNKDDGAVVITNNFVNQEANSNFSSNTIVLNGGIVRNDTNVTLNGRMANADVYGVYLMDRNQLVDNHVFIDHKVSNCTSTQLFKGIVDNQAKAVFNGHTVVRKDSQQTVALQNNNNIQLTDTAKIYSHPFLEIYADDVKCSHGSTVGQLDTSALFYLKQRGICDKNAKTLLMVAFVGQVTEKIKLESLRLNINNLVQKRLNGELTACENCTVNCNEPNMHFNFEI